ADVTTPVADFQRFPVIALAAAYVAGHVHVGQKVHFNLDHAVALTGLATSALHVERETAGIIAARARLGHPGKQFAYGREHAGVGGWIAARCAANRTLVDIDDLVEVR